MDMFLQIGDIKGDSTDPAHPQEINVLAWSWGMSRPALIQTGGGTSYGKASLESLSLTKYVDTSSAPLMKSCADGKRLPNAQLTLRTVGEQPLEFYSINMTNVMVVGISTGGSAGEDRLTENVTLDFERIDVIYHPVINTNLEPRILFDWDIVQNAGVAGVIPSPLPAPVPGLASTLSHTNGAPIAQLTWVSTAGALYRIWVTDNMGSGYQIYGNDIPSTGDGTTSTALPADAARKFFRVETVSVK